MTSKKEIESTLLAYYETQLAQYAQLLEQAHELPKAFADGDCRDALLAAMAAGLDRIAVTEANIQDETETFVARGHATGPLLGEIVGRKKRLLEELLGQLQIAESSAELVRARLLPQVDAHTRGQRMRDAYATSRNEV